MTSMLSWFVATPPAWLAAFVMVMVPIEVSVAARRGRPADRAETRTSLITGAVYFAVKIVAGYLVFFGVATAIYDRWRLFDWNPGPLGWIAAYLLGDFAYYWIHRSEHRVRVLWASHQVHHSSTDFNFAAAVRMPWTEIWFKPLTGLWAPFLGVPPAVAATLGIVGLMWGLLSHTSLVTSMGVLDKVLVTPTNHRVHHASNRAYLDTNFGGGLVIWDRMFGTYVSETEEPVFGLTRNAADRGPLTVGVGGFGELWHDVVATAGARPRLSLVLARP